MTINGIISTMVRKLNSFFYMQHSHSHCATSGIGVNRCKWDVTQITTKARARVKYAVLILNRPITQNQEFVKEFWNNATVRITVDGGTVRWDKYIGKLSEEVQKTLKLPDLVTGDFDSITDDVFKKYKKKGCKIVHTPDQDITDFTKALMQLNSHCQQHGLEMDHVIAVAQTSGRLDHTLGNIQTLFINKDRHILQPNTRLYIMSDDALSWLLCPGGHVITVPEESRTHRRAWCSLVPMGETCERVTSTGLKWNLDNQPLKFGDLVSTSNMFCGSEIVEIYCSHTILWSMRIPSLATGPCHP